MLDDSLRVLLHGFSFCILQCDEINVVISITQVAEKKCYSWEPAEGNSQSGSNGQFSLILSQTQ